MNHKIMKRLLASAVPSGRRHCFLSIRQVCTVHFALPVLQPLNQMLTDSPVQTVQTQASVLQWERTGNRGMLNGRASPSTHSPALSAENYLVP